MSSIAIGRFAGFCAKRAEGTRRKIRVRSRCNFRIRECSTKRAKSSSFSWNLSARVKGAVYFELANKKKRLSENSHIRDPRERRACRRSCLKLRAAGRPDESHIPGRQIRNTSWRSEFEIF